MDSSESLIKNKQNIWRKELLIQQLNYIFCQFYAFKDIICRNSATLVIDFVELCSYTERLPEKNTTLLKLTVRFTQSSIVTSVSGQYFSK